jgi:hypothetical protein
MFAAQYPIYRKEVFAPNPILGHPSVVICVICGEKREMWAIGDSRLAICDIIWIRMHNLWYLGSHDIVVGKGI